MARGDRGPKKFSFPLPRRSRTKTDDHDARPVPSLSSGPERPSRHDDSSSKAHRILGTSDVLHRSTSRQSTVPPSPGLMSIAVSDASVGSQIDDGNSATATDYSGYPKRPSMSNRPSSNVLGRSYTGDSRQGSDNGSVSHRLHPQTSNSTLRSHYDAKTSPLYISQQTSDSAVRDRALRRGQPPVLTDHGYDSYNASPLSPAILDETRKKEYRKSKPARLDLSKLFPKPKDSSEGPNYGTLLSPTKMVNSPAAMSVNSEYFPRPMMRQPTPQVGPAKLQKTKVKYQNPPTRTPISPVRKAKRDQYDSAKIHVRRPPKGVQHWFDALDEESEDSPEDTQQLHAEAAYSDLEPTVLDHTYNVGEPSRARSASNFSRPSQDHTSAYKRDSFALEDIVDITHLTSPSQYSVDTYRSYSTSKTKESALSKTNLQDSSVLSFSSSEDENDDRSRSRKGSVRKSLDSGDYTGEIVIGRAQAYEVRPHRRMQSSGKMSTLSTSTTATMEVMYRPEPPSLPSYHYPRNSTHSGGRWTSHVRQPSVIHEDEDSRPQTAVTTPVSPTAHSIVSARTSASAPQPQSEGSRKYMQVTPEEEALLELMRKKRAAMNKQGVSQAPAQEQDRHLKPTAEKSPPRRTSAFLSTDSLEPSHVRMAEAMPKHRASVGTSSSLAPSRGRSSTTESQATTSQLRDSSASDTWSDRNYSPASRGRLPHHFPTPAGFSQLDLFPPPSPTLAAGVASPTTTDHPSPLPSPMTPALCIDDQDVVVKVASSDTSNELDEFPMLDQGVISAPPERTKSQTSHRRRRTASSPTAIAFPVPPTSTGFRDMTPASDASFRAPSIVEPSAPKVTKKSARHISELALASIETRSRQGSVHSTGSRTSVYSQSSSYYNSAGKRRSRHLSPEDNITSSPRMTSSDRDSVSDDVLAAWNSLGGTY
ncbi:hypothetical protein G6011_05324 [Alternaria panax]|uniref:Uncharacterized protein n=1 Tax=Alternaria panax TaxID=48097 RepID=A0AAD4I6F5_9PLEO|nr:hypothetical protein G6011_05324 [Alternaria panax]